MRASPLKAWILLQPINPDLWGVAKKTIILTEKETLILKTLFLSSPN